MISLFEKDILDDGRRSSKGNQLKWRSGEFWYKADYAGYEGLAEYMVSGLLERSSLRSDEYVHYDTVEISYKTQVFRGCRSRNFLSEGRQLITLERLYHNQFARSFYGDVFKVPDVTERVKYLVDQVQRITGLAGFGDYLSKMLLIDAFFLNEDRHTHNIAVEMDAAGNFYYSPFFDQGAALLSDTTLDYPLGGEIYALIDSVHAKTVADDFDEQIDACDELYPCPMRFRFTKKDVDELLDKEPYYPVEIKERVRTILYDRMRKFGYLFAQRNLSE